MQDQSVVRVLQVHQLVELRFSSIGSPMSSNTTRPSSKSVRDPDEGANVAFMLASNRPPNNTGSLATSPVQRHTPVKHFAGSVPPRSHREVHFSCDTGWWPRAQFSSKHVDNFVFLALAWAHATAWVTDSMFGAKTPTQLTGPNGTGCNAKRANPGQA